MVKCFLYSVHFFLANRAGHTSGFFKLFSWPDWAGCPQQNQSCCDRWWIARKYSVTGCGEQILS
jgi:hypothetical protein